MSFRDELIETCARAMCASDYQDTSDGTRSEAWLNYEAAYRNHASVAVSTILDRLTRPTESMLIAGVQTDLELEWLQSERAVPQVFLAMIGAIN